MSQIANEDDLRRAVRRLNARAWGLTGGVVAGLGIFGATVILLLKGAPPGQEVGAHLNLLRYFFPGYSVSWVGSLIGFVYAFVLGYIIGRAVGTIYNKFVEDFPS